MMSWLSKLPDALTFLIVIGSIVLMTVIAVILPFRLRSEGQETNSETFDAFLAIASAAAVLLAFSLVQVDATTRAVEDAVSKEASAINSADRVLIRFGAPALNELRPMLLAYARSLIDDEWPVLGEGKRSETTDRLYTGISKGARVFEPAGGRQQGMYGELLKYLDDVADLREQRINAANTGLPGLFWVSVGMMIALMMVLAARMEPRSERIWTTGAISFAIGVLLALIIIIDAPFHGESSTVAADSIKRAMVQMSGRS